MKDQGIPTFSCGHERTPGNTYTDPDGDDRCRECRVAALRRWYRTHRAKGVKLVEPEAEVVPVTAFPVRQLRQVRVTDGYWLSLVRRAALLYPKDGLRVPYPEGMSPFSAIGNVYRAGKEAGVPVTVTATDALYVRAVGRRG